jgi:hypothetical protein
MAKKDGVDAKRRKLLGCDHFVRHNPMTDRFDMQRFHHLEFYALDATTTAKRYVKTRHAVRIRYARSSLNT